eukprot:4761164-Ditylum_brightwellii.AAC.1
MQFAAQYHRKPVQFSIRSYHNLRGKIVKRCYDGNKLKRTSGVPLSNMHPENMYYAKIASDIKFTSLDKRNVKIYPFTFFIQLSVDLRIILDDKGNSVTHNTFYGPSDWENSSNQAVLDRVWDSIASLKKPFVLCNPEIQKQDTDAIIDYDTPRKQLMEICLIVCWEDIANQ